MGYHPPPALCRAPGRQEVETKGMPWLWPPRVHLPTKNTHGARPFQSSEVVWFCCEVFRWLKLRTAPAASAQDPHPIPLASSDTADVHPEFSSMPGIPCGCFQFPFPSLSPSHTHLNCHPDSAVALPAELFLSAGQHLTTGVRSCRPNVTHKGLTVVEWHLIAVLGGYSFQQLGCRWGAVLNPKYVTWFMEANLAGQHFVAPGGPSCSEKVDKGGIGRGGGV